MEDEKTPPPVWTSDEDQLIINGRQKHDTFQALWQNETSLHPYGMAVVERRATELSNQLLLPDFLDKPPHFNPIDDSSNASAIASKTQLADSGRSLRRTKSANQQSQFTQNLENSRPDTTSQAPSGLIVPNNDSTTRGFPDPQQVKSTLPALETTYPSKSSAESSSSATLPTNSHANTAQHAAPVPVISSEQSVSVSVSSPKKASHLSLLSASLSSTPGRTTLTAPHTIELETENASTPPLATHSKRVPAGDLGTVKKNKPLEEFDRDDRSTDTSLETEDDDQAYGIGSSSSGKKKEKEKKKKKNEVLSPEELKIRQKHIRMEHFTKPPVHEHKSAERISEALLQSRSSEHTGTLGQNSSQVPSSEAPPKRRRGRPPGKKASAPSQLLSSPSPSPAATPTSTATSNSHYNKKSYMTPTSSLYSTAPNSIQETQPTFSRRMDVDEPSSASLAPETAQALTASFTAPVVDTLPPAVVPPSPELRTVTPSPISLTESTDKRKADKIAKKNLSRVSSTNGSGSTLDEKTQEPPAKKSLVDKWIVTPSEIHTMPSTNSTQNPVARCIATPTANLANIPDPAVASQKPIPGISASPVSSSAPIAVSSPIPLTNLMTNTNPNSVPSGTKSVISALYPAITPHKKSYVFPFPATPTASISRTPDATTPNGSHTQDSTLSSTILSTPRSSSNPNSFSAVRTTPISTPAPSTSTPIRRVTQWCPPTSEEIAAVPADQRALLLNFGSPDRYSPAFFKALYGSD